MRVRELVLWHVFNDITSLYAMSRENQFAALWFDDLAGAEAVLDQLIVPHVGSWPPEAKQEFGFSLGAALVHKRAQLIGSLMVTQWESFPDPADAMYGYVFRRLFPNRSLSEFVDIEISWDAGPIDDFLEEHGALPVHDWSQFSCGSPKPKWS